MRRGLCWCLCCLGLVACATQDPVRVHRADVTVGDTRISVSDGGSHPGSFCPPGQAKKGNC